jgi:aspartate aminotransferase
MSISKLARSIAESPTFALNEEARILRERGEPVINMSIGEPKNKTPITAVLSSASKLATGDVKYTPPDGTPSLKKAIVRYTEENYNRLVAPENIIISAGAKQSLFNILYSILNPQDEVIILLHTGKATQKWSDGLWRASNCITPEDGLFPPTHGRYRAGCWLLHQGHHH